MKLLADRLLAIENLNFNDVVELIGKRPFEYQGIGAGTFDISSLYIDLLLGLLPCSEYLKASHTEKETVKKTDEAIPPAENKAPNKADEPTPPIVVQPTSIEPEKPAPL